MRRKCACSAHWGGGLLLILFIVLIIFGAGKLPQLSGGIGKATKGFKKSVHDAMEEAVQHSAESPTTVSEIIQNIWSLLRKTITTCTCASEGHGWGKDGQNLTRQG